MNRYKIFRLLSKLLKLPQTSRIILKRTKWWRYLVECLLAIGLPRLDNDDRSLNSYCVWEIFSGQNTESLHNWFKITRFTHVLKKRTNVAILHFCGNILVWKNCFAEIGRILGLCPPPPPSQVCEIIKFKREKILRISHKFEEGNIFDSSSSTPSYTPLPM